MKVFTKKYCQLSVYMILWEQLFKTAQSWIVTEHIGQNHKQALCVSFGFAFFYYSKRLKVME
ncbi:hypothetical protein C5G87_01995 [Paenibacillus peoriae]|nr:hypothetical protein C5G87_01995 [Paenibacillus peoriae]